MKVVVELTPVCKQQKHKGMYQCIICKAEIHSSKLDVPRVCSFTKDVSVHKPCPVSTTHKFLVSLSLGIDKQYI